MKRSKQQLLGSLAAALLATAGLVSCSQEDGTDLSGGQLLEGKYPLVLTASVEGMTTRTSGKDAWTGDGSEYIGVRMVTSDTESESEYEAKYVISDAAGIVVQPATVDDSLFWLSPASATITSWYPYDAQTDVDISDQSSLEDFSSIDFLTATEENKPYGNTVELKFRHQMAKVSYTLAAGAGFTDEDLADAIVLFAGHTTASFSEGELTSSETENGWITPTSDNQVLLVPQNMTGEQFIKVSVNGSSYVFTPDTDTEANLQAGYHYTYNITVSATGLEVTVSTSVAWGSGTTGSETVYIGDGYTYTTDANGARTYTVTTEAGLNAWAEYASSNLSTNCTLANDITLTSSWTAIGDDSNQYTGTFDGNGYTITNLTISASSSYQGLIGNLGSDGVVKNLTLESVSITSSYSYVGAVVGYNSGTVTNCYSTGTVSGTYNTGGVVGYNTGTVTACYFTGTVYGGLSYIGGVVGMNSGGSVTACYSTGGVYGYSDIGGVLGNNAGTITACYSTASVNIDSTGGGGGNIGGVVGNFQSGTIADCYYGSSTSDSYATYVDGTTVTWETAKDAMNAELTGSGWQYTGDGTDTPPLTLVAE